MPPFSSEAVLRTMALPVVAVAMIEPLLLIPPDSVEPLSIAKPSALPVMVPVPELVIPSDRLEA